MEWTKSELMKYIVNPYMQALLIVLLSWLAAKIAVPVLSSALHRVTSKTKNNLDDNIVRVSKSPVTAFIVVLGAYAGMVGLPDQACMLVKIGKGALYAIGVSVVFYLINRVMVEVLNWYGNELANRTQTVVDKNFLPLADKLGKIFLFLSAAVIILRHFNYDITSVVVSLGIGSLAIGLAAKDTLENMISGFLIMIDRPFRLNDRIRLSGGETGDVVAIGIRSTKIKDLDNSIIVVPNRELITTKLTNFCYPDNQVKVTINVGVSYGSDISKVKELLLRIAENEPLAVKDPAPLVFFLDFGDSALDFLLLAWVKDFKDMFTAKDSLNTEIHRVFAEEGIEIPFPQQVIHYADK